LADEFELTLDPDAIQHLELELVEWDIVQFHMLDDRIDHVVVMCRDRGVVPVRKMEFDELQVVVVDVFLFGECDRRRLFVSPLDDAKVRLERCEMVDIIFRAVQVRLDDRPEAVEVCFQLLEQVERLKRNGQEMRKARTSVEGVRAF